VDFIVRLIDQGSIFSQLFHVNIGDISRDILVNFLVLDYHFDLPLHSHLLHDIDNDFNAQNLFGHILDAHVVNNFLNLVELLKLMHGIVVLSGVVTLDLFLFSIVCQVLSFHAFEYP
jgi:hypothetical protein